MASTSETPHSAAVRLGCTVDQVGYCARCHGYCHRYGKGGNPLCQSCRKDVQAK
ncbi:hypothetical protein GCM10009535_60680 [Streptomyces thermocarboxydovorans]|uniref:Uncharacterized protein n=1 Tax=Streptomyces thermocarboxydovorans TaxID=59298 RepID=A0ABN1HY53_9ACTN